MYYVESRPRFTSSNASAGAEASPSIPSSGRRKTGIRRQTSSGGGGKNGHAEEGGGDGGGNESSRRLLSGKS